MIPELRLAFAEFEQTQSSYRTSNPVTDYVPWEDSASRKTRYGYSMTIDSAAFGQWLDHVRAELGLDDTDLQSLSPDDLSMADVDAALQQPYTIVQRKETPPGELGHSDLWWDEELTHHDTSRRGSGSTRKEDIEVCWEPVDATTEWTIDLTEPAIHKARLAREMLSPIQFRDAFKQTRVTMTQRHRLADVFLTGTGRDVVRNRDIYEVCERAQAVVDGEAAPPTSGRGADAITEDGFTSHARHVLGMCVLPEPEGRGAQLYREILTDDQRDALRVYTGATQAELAVADRLKEAYLTERTDSEADGRGVIFEELIQILTHTVCRDDPAFNWRDYVTSLLEPHLDTTLTDADETEVVATLDDMLTPDTPTGATTGGATPTMADGGTPTTAVTTTCPSQQSDTQTAAERDHDHAGERDESDADSTEDATGDEPADAESTTANVVVTTTRH